MNLNTTLADFQKNPENIIGILSDFTDTYRANGHNKYLREALCCKVQWPVILNDIELGDLFAGRPCTAFIGFLAQEDKGSTGYYCYDDDLNKLKFENTLSNKSKNKIDELIAFWKDEATTAKAKKQFTPEMTAALPSDLYYNESGIAFTLWRLSGIQLDYYKLVHFGIPGLRAEIIEKQHVAEKESDSWKLYNAMLISLDTFGDVCSFYGNQASELAKKTEDSESKTDLIEISRILLKLLSQKPESFREGIQLISLYTVLDRVRNYGRLDDALADLYCHDIDKNVISEEEAVRLLSGLWKLIIARNQRYDSRIIIGGAGRHNEANANRLAMAMMETTRRVNDIVPQLAFRFSENQDPKLYQKALDVIGEGNTFPMLYNDDVNISSVVKAFNLPYEEAIQAIQYGCGEYVINHRSVGTPSAVINSLAALNVTLHKGIDPVTGKLIGMPKDRYEKYSNFETFEQLFSAYKEQIEYHIVPLAQHEKLEYDVAGKEAAHLMTSMLMDDCIARGKGIYEGGIRYLGGTLELYGNTNTVDSLVAIKQLVYEQKKFSLEQLLTMIDADFVGFEKERKMLLNCPKYGNDNEIADAMLIEVHNHICQFTRKQNEAVGLHSYLIVNINNDANTVIGEHTSASADGRKAFTFMNPGNAPVGGADKSGTTAFLNSIAKPASDIHAGTVQNMKFSKELFNEHRIQLENLLATYWQKGGAQAMLTVLGRDDLEAAMAHPELYQNLIVRVGGFSERFVNLPRHTQLEVLSRTLN